MTGTGPGQNTPAGDVRFIGDVPGRFVLVDRSSARPEVQAYPFSARSVSSSKAVVTAAVPVERGERVALHFDGIGIRRGIVERVLRDGFTVVFTEGDEAGENVAARIGWLNRKSRGRAEDRRQHKRVIPKNAVAILILGAENMSECRIRDMSASGAAIITDARPAIGTLLAVGAVPGRVIRHFESGFAMRFLELQALGLLEGQLTLRTTGEKALAARRLRSTG